MYDLARQDPKIAAVMLLFCTSLAVAGLSAFCAKMQNDADKVQRGQDGGWGIASVFSALGSLIGIGMTIFMLWNLK